MSVRVEHAVVADAELLEAVRRLLPQLSESATTPEAYDLESIVDAPTTSLLVARDDVGLIVGMLSLVVFRVPTGVRAWIEDVVVDGSARRLGAGRELVAEALRLAGTAGAITVDLTSRPSRASAHELYLSMGFAVRETTVYRRTL